MKRFGLLVATSIISLATNAAGWTSVSTPNTIMTTDSAIILSRSSWGDKMNCGNSGKVAILKSQPLYQDAKQLIASSSLNNGPSLSFYVSSCVEVVLPDGSREKFNQAKSVSTRRK